MKKPMRPISNQVLLLYRVLSSSFISIFNFYHHVIKYFFGNVR